MKKVFATLKRFAANVARLVEKEPARAFQVVRLSAYLIAGTYAAVETEQVDQVLMILAAVMGVDVASTEGTRSRVFSPETVKELVDDKSELTRLAFEVAEVVKPAKTTKADLINVVAPIVLQHRGKALTSDLKSQMATEIHSALLHASDKRKK